MTRTTPTLPPAERTFDGWTSGTGSSPVEASAELARGGSHVVGACSIEAFCNVGGLSLTHEDAQGFLSWLAEYGIASNFWFQDSAVKIWEYYEQYDNWQDTYGMDADLISYHSGHGGMDGNGVFYAPMGAAWAGNDCTASSNTMALGNEYCRYLFWSTCQSLRIGDGNNPIKTWNAANKGLRMIFGFESNSWDDPHYGSNFGTRYKAGDTFSSAWLNGSWAIAHDQSPVVAACGASAAEAQDRVFNERSFQWGAVSTNYWWWRWYDAVASAARDRNLTLPAQPMEARLAPAGSRSVRALAERFGLDASRANVDRTGASIADGGRRLTVTNDGMVVAHLDQPNRGNRTALDPRDARAAAAEALRQYGLDADGPVVIDRIAEVNEGGGAADRPDTVDGPFRTATLVQYRQVINNVPVISPGAGTLQVMVDNDGTVTSITATTRSVEQLRAEPYGAPTSDPPAPNATAASTQSGPPDHEQLLAKAFSDRLRALAVKGDLPVGFDIVPGTTEVGYDVRGNQALLVAQRAVELDYGQGFKKRYWIRTPLFS